MPRLTEDVIALSVSRMTHERANGRRPNIVSVGKQGVILYKVINFGVDPRPDMNVGSVFHFL